MEFTDSAQTQLSRLAQKISREESLPFRESLVKAARQRPDLHERARQEVLSDEPSPFARDESAGDFREPNHPAQDEMVRLAEERMRKRGIRFAEAILEIARERPLLTELARKESIRE